MSSFDAFALKVRIWSSDLTYREGGFFAAELSLGNNNEKSTFGR